MRSLAGRHATAIAVVSIALIYVWFWSVAAHRIDGHPWVGFAGVFTTNCGDFEHFYYGALALRQGTDLYGSGVNGYIYPPLIAFLFAPLTFVPVKTAAFLMLFVNLGLGLACTWIASREAVRRFGIDPSARSIVLVMAVTSILVATKLRIEFQMWQTNILLLFALVLALRELEARPWLAGMLLGAAVNIKYLPIVFLPYLLIRRRFTAAVWCVVGIVFFAMLPAALSGWDTNLSNLAIALAGVARLVGIETVKAGANVDPITAGYSLSITSGIARLLAHYATRDTVMQIALVTSAGLLQVFNAVYRSRGLSVFAGARALVQTVERSHAVAMLEWSALMAFALAFSPQTNARHLSLLLLVFAPMAAMLVFPRAELRRWPLFVALAILFLGTNLPPTMPQFAEQVAWWRNTGAEGWCIALSLPFFLIAGFDHAMAQASSASAQHDPARRSAANVGLLSQELV